MDPGFVKGDSRNLPKVDLNMVHEFYTSIDLFSSSESRGVKDARSSKSSYGDSAIGYVQVLRKDDHSCTVQAKITPEHRITSKAYKCTVKIDEKEKKVISCVCLDCTASEGGCKHALAMLFWMHRRSEEPSVTEVECYWTKSKLSKVSGKVKKLTEMYPGQKSIPNISGSFLQYLENLKDVKDCIIINHLIKRPTDDVDIHKLILQYINFDGTDDPNDFLNFCKNSMQNIDFDHIEKLTIQQSSSPQWHTIRYGRITASKFYEVAKCKTLEGSLFATIMGGHKEICTDATTRGKLLEKKVLQAVSVALKTNIEPCGLFIDKEYPIFAASPDGINESYCFEVKCPIKESSKKIISIMVLLMQNVCANVYFK